MNISENTIITTLKNARALITDPDHWTQHTYACTEKNDPVDVTNEHAFSFCIVGALMKYCGCDDKLLSECLEKLDEAALETEPGTVELDEDMSHPCMSVNDLSGHNKVLKLFDYVTTKTKTDQVLQTI